MIKHICLYSSDFVKVAQTRRTLRLMLRSRNIKTIFCLCYLFCSTLSSSLPFLFSFSFFFNFRFTFWLILDKWAVWKTHIWASENSGFLHQKILCSWSRPWICKVLCIDIDVYKRKKYYRCLHLCVLSSGILLNQTSVCGIWVRKSLLTFVAICLFPEAQAFVSIFSMKNHNWFYKSLKLATPS